MIGYTAWFCVGLVLATLAGVWQARHLPPLQGVSPAQRQALLLFAIGGAVLGAYLLQLPADLMQASAAPPLDRLPLGRTVLGGLIGGWLGVEFGKYLAGIRTPTGDTFALPLACALACGRLGCWSAGCCAGAPCPPGGFATLDAAGVARYPVQLLEAAFHFAAALALALATVRRAAPQRRLAIYLSAYAGLRFALEFVRENPTAALGLTWHQLLALALLGLAGGTWIRRRAQG